MDINELKGLMAKHGHKQKDLARLLGISMVSVNMKLCNKRKFNDDEIAKIIAIYKIDANILFSNKNSL